MRFAFNCKRMNVCEMICEGATGGVADTLSPTGKQCHAGGVSHGFRVIGGTDGLQGADGRAVGLARSDQRPQHVKGDALDWLDARILPVGLNYEFHDGRPRPGFAKAR